MRPTTINLNNRLQYEKILEQFNNSELKRALKKSVQMYNLKWENKHKKRGKISILTI